ncbi:transcription factor bHLH143-like [Macadamia integrifolia]|uniref:transcription factor bHLH143-like n=1 Tax=Macadamia integrifolia TaxID=60698 RepID=UPI001C4F542C|nr:transcription factor bHLH143-like [Macadamia integrifolia]XP_042507233.1 transcription factor bHLH143-like [Macadamia integrifolia]
MGKNCGSWIHQQHSALQQFNMNCTSPMPDLGLDNTFPAYANPQSRMASGDGTLPVPGFAFPELGQLKMSQAAEPHGWFYCLPRHRQAAFAPPNCIGTEKFSAFPHGCYGQGAAASNAEPGSVEKQFLVFDQSGNQTSFFISSVIAPSVQVQHPSYKIQNPFDTELATSRDPIYQSGPVVSGALDENHESDDGSEMHEDTEELNALLYSDDEFEDTDGGEEDDEVASTGHSPIEMTGHENQEDEAEEEVASSGSPTKRRKLLNGEHEATSSIMDTASSAKPNGLTTSYYEDDAQSSCIKGRAGGREMGSLKRSRKEKIRETVSILQSIIPGGKGKDAALVLDEAIQYLRSLKVKAKSLGTSTTLK